MQALLEIRGVSKQFHNSIALDRVSLDIPKGKTFGLLGPNGAGKTTLIRIITQIIGPDAGEVFLNGHKLTPADRHVIGYMPEERGLYKKMKVGEQLVYLAQLKGLTRQQAQMQTIYWMRKLDIGNWWNKKVDELSKGMSQKIQFISTIIHEPTLLILDEPFSGLDPVNANLIKHEILELKEKGTTIIFSTHRMESVEEMCDHIALVDHGHIILEGQVAAIQQEYKENQYEVLYEGELPAETALFQNFNLLSNSEGVLLFKLQPDQSANALLKALIAANIDIHGLREILPSVNDIFIKKVARSA